MIPFDTKNPEQVAKAYALAKRMVAEAGKRGYGEYRAHLSFMDLAADQFGFNDHALAALQRDDQGHPRPERDHRSGQVRDLGHPPARGRLPEGLIARTGEALVLPQGEGFPDDSDSSSPPGETTRCAWRGGDRPLLLEHEEYVCVLTYLPKCGPALAAAA